MRERDAHILVDVHAQGVQQLCREVVMFAALLLWVLSELYGFSLVPA